MRHRSWMPWVTLALAWSMGACRGPSTMPATPGSALRPCPATPNCVSTDAAEAAHAMPPVPFTDVPAAALARARAALLAEPRTRIVEERARYLHAESRSRILRFVDDVEIVVDDDARLFRFRSASRVGRGDLGVNRARMTRVSERLARAPDGVSATDQPPMAPRQRGT